MGVPLLAVHRAIAPIRIGAERVVIGPLARLIAPSVPPPELSSRELEIMLSMSRQRGIIDQDEQQLLRHVLDEYGGHRRLSKDYETRPQSSVP